MDRHEKKRIHARLQGGLGNQLFIWAAGFSLAERVGGTLSLDDGLIPKLNRNRRLDRRKFELDYFNIRRSRLPLSSRRSMGEFFEEGFDYDSRFAAIDSSVVLHGYFQSWRYMEGQQQRIREFLIANARYSKSLDSVRKELGNDPWVGVHVRRGDYLRVGVLNIVGREYYAKAIPAAREQSGAERFVVFSDDIGLAREIVPGASHYIGAGNLQSPSDTLMLLAKSNAFVGANSSFSWWAAFLNQNSNAFRVFPKQWFSDRSISCPDLLAEDWRRL